MAVLLVMWVNESAANSTHTAPEWTEGRSLPSVRQAGHLISLLLSGKPINTEITEEKQNINKTRP
jgi:hypothetical protein